MSLISNIEQDNPNNNALGTPIAFFTVDPQVRDIQETYAHDITLAMQLIKSAIPGIAFVHSVYRNEGEGRILFYAYTDELMTPYQLRGNTTPLDIGPYRGYYALGSGELALMVVADSYRRGDRLAFLDGTDLRYALETGLLVTVFGSTVLLLSKVVVHYLQVEYFSAIVSGLVDRWIMIEDQSHLVPELASHWPIKYRTVQDLLSDRDGNIIPVQGLTGDEVWVSTQDLSLSVEVPSGSLSLFPTVQLWLAESMSRVEQGLLPLYSISYPGEYDHSVNQDAILLYCFLTQYLKIPHLKASYLEGITIRDGILSFPIFSYEQGRELERLTLLTMEQAVSYRAYNVVNLERAVVLRLLYQYQFPELRPMILPITVGGQSTYALVVNWDESVYFPVDLVPTELDMTAFRQQVAALPCATGSLGSGSALVNLSRTPWQNRSITLCLQPKQLFSDSINIPPEQVERTLLRQYQIYGWFNWQEGVDALPSPQGGNTLTYAPGEADNIPPSFTIAGYSPLPDRFFFSPPEVEIAAVEGGVTIAGLYIPIVTSLGNQQLLTAMRTLWSSGWLLGDWSRESLLNGHLSLITIRRIPLLEAAGYSAEAGDLLIHYSSSTISQGQLSIE